MPPLKAERCALLSVTDKTGIVELAYALRELGYAILAAGPIAATLRQAEVEVTAVHDFLGSSALEGALGLLHPKILGGIAADREQAGAMHELERRGAPTIDLVAVNLYPVAEAASDNTLSQSEILTYLDLAGSAILRAAARNFRHVIPLCDPDDYQPVIETLKQYKGLLSRERRQSLAAKAFHCTAYYDSTAAQYLGSKWDKLPDELVIGLKKTEDFAYGENPQQQGALYTLSGARPWGINAAKLLCGKPLSYNHYLDLEAAWELATEILEPACVIVKHAVPAGVASAKRLGEAARQAYRGDPRGGFRGTAAVNRTLDEEAALFFAEEFVSCIAAPDFSPQALAVLKTKKDIRLVTLPSILIAPHETDLKSIAGGVLVQDKDNQAPSGEPRPVTKRAPSENEVSALKLAWLAAKHARSHAAIICRGTSTIGIGSGQTSRLDALRTAFAKSSQRHPIVSADLPLVLASDGALSAEHISEAAKGGVTAVIEPGGSSEDHDAIEACDAKNIAMVFTGVRHFRH